METNIKNPDISRNRTLILEYKTLAPFLINNSQYNVKKEYFGNLKEFEKRAKEIINNSYNDGNHTVLTYEIKFYGLTTLAVIDKEERITKMFTNLYEFETLKEIKNWYTKDKRKENGEL